MKDVLVFFSYRSHNKGYIEKLFARLSDTAAKRGQTLQRGSLSDLRIQIKDNQLKITEALTGKDLKDFGAVYFELWYKAQQQALAAALYLDRHNIPFFSHEMLNIVPMTKVGELAKLADNDIPLPNSLSSSRRGLKMLVKESKLLQYPFVLKAADGYGGKNNHLVENYTELSKILDPAKDMTFIAQEYIPNDCDFRCIVLGGQIRVVLQRTRSKKSQSHLNNTSQGAEGKVVPLETLSEAAQSDVLKAATILGRSQFAGVDLVINKETGQHYILEVNQTPQIEIGAEVDYKMNQLLDYVQELAEGKNQ